MSSEESKLLIKIGKSFEATAIGNIAVGSVVLIVFALLMVGYSFV